MFSSTCPVDSRNLAWFLWVSQGLPMECGGKIGPEDSRLGSEGWDGMGKVGQVGESVGLSIMTHVHSIQ